MAPLVELLRPHHGLAVLSKTSEAIECRPEGRPDGRPVEQSDV